MMHMKTGSFSTGWLNTSVSYLFIPMMKTIIKVSFQTARMPKHNVLPQTIIQNNRIILYFK